MGTVMQNHAVANNDVPDDTDAERTEGMNLRRAVMVSFGTLVVLGMFVAYGSAAVARDAASESYNTAACAGDSTKTCTGTQVACPGDTRGDQGTVKCDHDSTHRVCAKIGDTGTSFWSFTGQSTWCGKNLYGNGGNSCYGTNADGSAATADSGGNGLGTWCICKWATARWIHGVWPSGTAGQSCPDTIDIDCDATDICTTHQGLYFSYGDFGVNLQPARACAMDRCSAKWTACADANGDQGNGAGHDTSVACSSLDVQHCIHGGNTHCAWNGSACVGA